MASANIQPIDCQKLSIYVKEQVGHAEAGDKLGPIVSDKKEVLILSFWITQMIKRNFTNDGLKDPEQLSANFIEFCFMARGDTEQMILGMKNALRANPAKDKTEDDYQTPRTDIESGPNRPSTEMEI